MKQKMKKYAKVWLSAFLTLVIVLQAFAGMEFDAKAEESNITYTTKMKFTDWGNWKVEDYDCQIYSLTNTDRIKSLDGVKVEGKLNFNGDASTLFRIGGIDVQDQRHGGFAILTQEETGDLLLWPQLIGGNGEAHVVVPSYEWATLVHTEFTLGMGFSKADDNTWIVEVFINDELRGTYDCGTATPGLLLANQGVEFANAYKEMKFSDWQWKSTAPDGSYSVYLPADTSITSLDGVAVSGPVNFNNVSGGSVIIGGSSAMGGFAVSTNTYNWVYLSQFIGGTNTVWADMDNPNGVCKPTGDVELRMTFDKVYGTDNWTIKVYADGVKVGEYAVYGPNMGVYLTISTAITVYHTQRYESKTQSLYKEMKFTDWGRHVADITDYDMYQLTDSKLLDNGNLDGVAVSGIVNFNGTTWKTISIGGKYDAQHGGFRIANIGANYKDDIAGTTSEAPVGWGCDTTFVRDGGTEAKPTDWLELGQAETETDTANLITGDVLLRVTFNLTDATTNQWTINVYANGTWIDTKVYKEDFGTYIAIADEVTVKMPTPKEMEFSDWGIYEGKRNGLDIYSLSDKSKITTLDKVAIEGMVNYNGNASAYFRIGGYRTDTDDSRHMGIGLGKENATAYTLWTEGITAPGAEGIAPWEMPVDWSSLINTPFKLRVELFKDIGTGEWSCLVLINDSMVQCYNLGQINPGLYMSSYAAPVAEGLGGSGIYIYHDKGYYIEDKYYYDKAYQFPTSITKNDGTKWETLAYKMNDVALTGSTYGTIGEHIMSYTCKRSGSVSFEQANKLVIYIAGDANCDETVDICDLVRMTRWEQKPEEITNDLVHTKSADVDKDETVTTEDTADVLDLLLYKIP